MITRHNSSIRKAQITLFIVFVLLCVVVGCFLHFWHLNAVPVSLYYDEMDYVVTGEAVARFGTDLSGQWRPEQLLPLHTMNYTAELPSVYQAFFQKIFGYGTDSARYPASFFGLLNIVLCMVITQLLLKDKKTTVFVATVLFLNPWHVHISRSGYEAMSAVFFELVFLLGFLLHIDSRFSQKWKILSTLFMLSSLFVGFYSYHGAKFTLPVLSIVSIVMMWCYQRNRKLNLIVTTCLLLLLSSLLFRTYLLNKQGVFGERQSETVFNSAQLSAQVDAKRKQSLSLPGEYVVENKVIVLIDEMIKHYASVFDFYRLTINGLEGTYQFSLVVHGFFYLSTLCFLVIGLRFVLVKEYKSLQPLLIFFLVSPVASVITLGYQSIFRSALTYSLMLIFAGIGLSIFVSKVWKNHLNFQLLLQFFVYVFLIGDAAFFGYKYFSQYPIISADNQFFYEKLLAGYLGRQKKPVIVVAERYAYSYARSYIEYQQLMPILSLIERQQFSNPSSQTYTVGQITFTQTCPDATLMNSDAVQVVESGMYQYCHYDQTGSQSLMKKPLRKYSLGSPIDSRSYFYLINDPTCKNTQLSFFISVKELSDFDVLRMSDDLFCKTWLKEEATSDLP